MTLMRAAKAPRLENIQLHQLLIDEVPALDISNANLGLNAVSKMFDIHNYAWAMVQACHLHRLRAYTLKFMSFLTIRLDSESGLRPPSILEAQQADKQLWHSIAELCEDPEWSLDEALPGVHTEQRRYGGSSPTSSKASQAPIATSSAAEGRQAQQGQWESS